MMTLVLFPSSAPITDSAEDRIARLTDAAYQVALQNGLTGSFVEVQLGIWSAIRSVIESEHSSVENDAEYRKMPARIAGIR